MRRWKVSLLGPPSDSISVLQTLTRWSSAGLFLMVTLWFCVTPSSSAS
jgi:hypothetical protein